MSKRYFYTTDQREMATHYLVMQHRGLSENETNIKSCVSTFGIPGSFFEKELLHKFRLVPGKTRRIKAALNICQARKE